MIFVIFSDIHGNQYAFDEFIKELKNIPYDRAVFCGDIYGYYYGQDKIIDSMFHIQNLFAVKGNHDQYALDIFEGKKDKKDLYFQYGHSYENLLEDTIDYLKNLPKKIEFVEARKKYIIIHGMPNDILEGRLYPDEKVDENIVKQYMEYDFVLSGHTHFRTDRMIGKTRVINPGSLGQQRDGKGFSYAIFDSITEQLEFRNITFSFTELENEIRERDPENKKMIEILHRGE